MNERRFVDAVRDALVTSQIDLRRPVVAAVSGGADSMALLEALRELGVDRVLDVVAAHFNHGLRGAESDRDERFVIDWCEAHQVQCVTGHAAARETGGGARAPAESPEAAARTARYGFLARVQADVGASAVATGHTLDDQAETVLLHLVRGSGLAGLQGMRPLSELRVHSAAQPVTVVRPLLALRRADTEAFCVSRGIVARRDITNEDVGIPRNRIRLQVLPLMRSINPSAAEAIARLSYAAHDDLDFVSAAAELAWSELRRNAPAGGQTARIARAGFGKLHPALRRRVLMKMHSEVAGGLEGLAMDHVEAMLSLAGGRSGTSLDLPGGLRFAVAYRSLTMRSADAPPDPTCPFPVAVSPTTLPVPGSADLGGGFVIHAEAAASRKPYRSSRWTVYLDPECVSGPLTVRARERGDLFRPHGMADDKKLQDFFVDSKVPRPWRDRVPLVVTRRGIAWVVGYRVADWALVRAPGAAVRLAATPAEGAPLEDSD